jgi:glyoxylase-like metal-dependent hydrolase (beta-lactamase superfamily II)
LRVNDYVYALDSTKGNYSYIILGGKNILVDTGRPGQGKGILNDLKSINVKPHDIEHILLTHHDLDHVGSAAFLQQETGAHIWASKVDIPYINGEKNREGIKRFLSYVMRVTKPDSIDPYPDDQKIGDVNVISTPGHTPGHVCLLYRDVLFAGDLFRTSNGMITPMRSFINWNDTILKESITKIDGYDFEWICPAHGQPLKRDGTLKRYIEEFM